VGGHGLPFFVTNLVRASSDYSTATTHGVARHRCPLQDTAAHSFVAQHLSKSQPTAGANKHVIFNNQQSLLRRVMLSDP
jgi:hypothetical protein